MDSQKSTPPAFVPPVATWTLSDAANAKVALSGKVDVYSLGLIWAQIRSAQNVWLAQGAANSKTLTFDASKVDSLDGAGIAFLIDLQEAQQKAGGTFTLVGLDARLSAIA